MIIILNGPLGIGKSTLAETLAESIDHCVMLDGDHLVAANPPPVDETEFLHSTIALLVAHCRRFGYHHFVLFERPNGDLGEPFDVSASPARLVETILLRLGLR